MKRNNKETMFTIKTVLYHKVQNYAFEGEELRKMNRAVAYADSAFPYEIHIEEIGTDFVTISISNVPESKKDTTVKEVSVMISQFMYVESQKVKDGLRKGRTFMFKGAEHCPIEYIEMN